MLDLFKKRERVRMLVALALSFGSTSAVVAGTFAVLTYGTHVQLYSDATPVA